MPRTQISTTTSGVPPMVIWILGLSLLAAHLMVTGTADTIIQAARGQSSTAITMSAIAQTVGALILIAALALWAEASPSGGTIGVLLLIGLWIGWGMRNLKWIEAHVGMIQGG